MRDLRRPPRTGNAGKGGSKSYGYGRQMQQPAGNKKGPQTNEYENDPEYIAFLASFNDGTADGAAHRCRLNAAAVTG